MHGENCTLYALFQQKNHHPRETNMFQISVNMARHAKVNFNLTYQEVLQRVHRVYKHVINIQPDHPVDDIQVDVLIAERHPINRIHVPEFDERIGHISNKELLNVPEATDVEVRTTNDNSGSLAYIYFKPESNTRRTSGQLVILYDVTRGRDGGEIRVVNGYFVHFFAAPNDVHRTSKHVVFVLDRSGSMKGDKLKQMKQAMYTILDELDGRDRLNLIVFNNAIEQWRSSSITVDQHSIVEAKNFVRNLRSSGGTNIQDALIQAVNLLNDDHRTDRSAMMIVFLTDGQPTVGETNARKIIDKISIKNGHFSIHSLAFGVTADYGLLQRISVHNHGLARKIYEDSDAALQITGFYHEIGTPLLRDVKVKYISENVDIGSLVEENSDILFSGGETMTVGKVKFDKNQDVKIRVSGRDGKQLVQLDARSSSVGCFPRLRKTESEVDKFDKIMRKNIMLCDEMNEEQIDSDKSASSVPLASNTAGGFIERMWAYKSIKKYSQIRDVQADKPIEIANVERQIRNIALKYGFVTDYTSMVIVLPNEKEQRKLQIKHDEDNIGFDFFDSFEPIGFGQVQNSVKLPSTLDKSNANARCHPDIFLILDRKTGKIPLQRMDKLAEKFILRIGDDSNYQPRFLLTHLRNGHRFLAVFHKLSNHKNGIVDRLTSSTYNSTIDGMTTVLKSLKSRRDRPKTVILFTDNSTPMSRRFDSYLRMIGKFSKIIVASVSGQFQPAKRARFRKTYTLVDHPHERSVTRLVSC